jgi:hypothetical protein
LLGLAGLSLVGCGKHLKLPAPAPTPPSVAVPDAAALLAAREGERRLLASYDAKIAHASAHERPRLQVARAIHATHLSALHGSTSTTADVSTVKNLTHALLASARSLRALALHAVVGENAALLASIAAAHEAGAQ